MDEMDILQRFTDVIKTKSAFTGIIGDHRIEIQYAGWVCKNLNSYKIQIWTDECGCTYEDFKRFSCIDDAIIYFLGIVNK